MSSRTLVAVHRSMERDHDVLPPVRRPTPFRSSAGRLPVEERGQQSASVNTVTFSNLPPLRRRSSGLMAADRLRGETGRPTARLITAFVHILAGRGLAICEGTPPQGSAPAFALFIIGPRTWADKWGMPDLLGSPSHRPAQHVLIFPSIDNWTTNLLIT